MHFPTIHIIAWCIMIGFARREIKRPEVKSASNKISHTDETTSDVPLKSKGAADSVEQVCVVGWFWSFGWPK